MELDQYTIEKIRDYQERRANEEHFEIEEMFDLLDGIDLGNQDQFAITPLGTIYSKQ